MVAQPGEWKWLGITILRRDVRNQLDVTSYAVLSATFKTFMKVFRSIFNDTVGIDFLQLRGVMIKTAATRAVNVCGHTTLKAPVLVRSPKLSNVGPG